MNRAETIQWCRKCLRRKFDPKQGLVCDITNEKGAFVATCENFKLDKNADVILAPELEPVKAKTRFLNMVIDILAFYLLVFIIAVFINLFDLHINDGMSFNLLSYMLFFLYFFLFESLTGQTLGKMLTGTIAVMKNGEKLSTKSAAIRSVGRFIPFEAFTFLKERPVGWHDSIAGTKVIVYKKKTDLSDDVLDVDFE